ncbi:MAG: SGNH/GDSL hydrolase family protein [Bacteroidota bacterium]
MKRNVFIYITILIILTIIILYSTRLIGDPCNFSKSIYYLRVLLIIITFPVLLKIVHLIIKSGLKDRYKRYLLTVSSIVMLFLLFEAIFMFVSRSFGTSYPLADQNWVRKYWKPINSFGYRDAEVDVKLAKSKNNILVIGSSYVAGDGIRNTEDRFSGRLQKKISDNYQVYNLGYCGSDALDEYNRLLEFPVKPDILILSHTTKSINGAVERSKLQTPEYYKVDEGLNAVSAFLIQNSYLLNYVFWKYYGTKKLFPQYIEDIEHNAVFFYLQEEILSRHLLNLDRFIQYCNQKAIPLIVVSFPALNNGIAFTKMIVNNPIENFFNERGVIYISVYDLVKDLPESKRTINSNDSHPSVLVNKIIAEELYKTLVENNIVK